MCDRRSKKVEVSGSAHDITMAAVQTLNVVAPPLDPAYTPPTPSGSRLSRRLLPNTTFLYSPQFVTAPHPAGHRTLLPVGPAYLNHLKLSLKHAHDFAALDKHLEEELQKKLANEANGVNGEDDLGVGDEPESEELLNLDPKEWKVNVCIPIR